MAKEQKIASFQQGKDRLQLLKITKEEIIRYQVRLNRKIIDTSISEYKMRNVFTTYCRSMALKLEVLLK